MNISQPVRLGFVIGIGAMEAGLKKVKEGIVYTHSYVSASRDQQYADRG